MEVPSDAFGDLAVRLAGRGSSFADIDGDGDLDVLLAQVGRPPVLLRNDQDLGHHWLRVRLAGDEPNAEAIGARITVTADGREMRRLVTPTRSYLSQSELPITFGLGQVTSVESIEVRWPDGYVSRHDAPQGVDREILLTQKR